MTTLVKAFHELQNALIDIGVKKEKADRVTEAFTDMIENQLATKGDVREIKNEMKTGFREMRTEMKYLRWFVGLAIAGIALDILTKFIV